MVEIVEVECLSDRRQQTSSDKFPPDELATIRSAVEQVPEDIFKRSVEREELGDFDARIAESLPGYEYEGTRAGGYNPACKLWSHLGFEYSVDLYNPIERIAIEVEKSERKNVSDDLLKFQKGYRTQQNGRPKIEFGCLVVPVNYRGSDNLYRHSLTKLDFMKGVLFIDDVAVVGYRIPKLD
jgi:hypothetical protein